MDDHGALLLYQPLNMHWTSDHYSRQRRYSKPTGRSKKLRTQGRGSSHCSIEMPMLKLRASILVIYGAS